MGNEVQIYDTLANIWSASLKLLLIYYKFSRLKILFQIMLRLIQSNTLLETLPMLLR